MPAMITMMPSGICRIFVSVAGILMSSACDDAALGPNSPEDKGCTGCGLGKWFNAEEEDNPQPLEVVPAQTLASSDDQNGPPPCTGPNPDSKGCSGCTTWAMTDGLIAYTPNIGHKQWNLELSFESGTVNVSEQSIRWRDEYLTSLALPAGTEAMGPFVGGQLSWFESEGTVLCCNEYGVCQEEPFGVLVFASVLPAFTDY